MDILCSYFILTVYCLFCLTGKTVSTDIIISFLSAVITISASIVLPSRKRAFPCYLYAVCSFFAPSLCFFLPMLIPETERRRDYPCMGLFAITILIHFANKDITLFLYLLLGCGIAFFLQYLLGRHSLLEKTHRKMRDDSMERNLLLKQRNHSLLEKQDYEIHNATLQERNRIAREIHDNVGHLLSRCILLNGAVLTINQDKNCEESLQLLQDTLTQAMDNIRTSVHNLHDDSVNLQAGLQALVQAFDFCDIHMEYDMNSDVPSAVRYAFLSITKEALTNVSRHSNATMVSVILREHPAMYQLIIQDNGTIYPKKTFSLQERQEHGGIGLINIQDRVRLLEGNLQINTENGFQIFVSVPKGQEERKTEHEDYNYR